VTGPRTIAIRFDSCDVHMPQRNPKLCLSGRIATEFDMRDQRLDRGSRRAGGTLLARLSPSALAHWPAVAKQMSDAGVLGNVDEESLVRYCEAFAKWCTAGDQLATMLIQLALTASRRTQAQVDVSQNTPPPTPATETRPESVRRAPNAIMRRAEVEMQTGLSRSTIYQRIKAGTFPAPVHLGERSVGWRVSDIEAFLSSPTDYRPLA
jgi:predicted DNA-binding transcriptional regulator AlpA